MNATRTRFDWRLLGRRAGNHAVLIMVIVGVGAFATVRAPVFLTSDNLIEILLATSTYFIVACPMAVLIISGGLDFSVGATFSLGAAVACSLMVHGVWWPAAFVIGVAAGGLAGVVGGGIVSYLRVTPIIATLSVYLIVIGLIDVLVPDIIAPLPGGFLGIGQGDFIHLPKLVWYALVVGVVFWALLEKRPFGYNVRATGGNRMAAASNGIPVRRLELTLYCLCGAFAAMAGILFSARTSAGQPGAGGLDVTLRVLTAVLVGGVSLSGGVGTIGGAALGSLLFGELQNALGVANFNPALSNVFIGVVLIFSVALDGARRRRQFQREVAAPPPSTSVSVARLELPRVINTQERTSSARVVAAVDDARRRIERDLHDGAQQQLVNAALLLSTATERIESSSDENIRRLLVSTTETLRSALGELRELSRGAYPAVLSERGLVPAIEALAERTVIPIELHASRTGRMPQDVETAAYFIISEAVTNTLKHANAEYVSVKIDNDGDQVVLEITDNGVGFEPDPDAPPPLRSLRDRVRSVDGDLTLRSSLGTGTTVIATLPLTSEGMTIG